MCFLVSSPLAEKKSSPWFSLPSLSRKTILCPGMCLFSPDEKRLPLAPRGLCDAVWPELDERHGRLAVEQREEEVLGDGAATEHLVAVSLKQERDEN